MHAAVPLARCRPTSSPAGSLAADDRDRRSPTAGGELTGHSRADALPASSARALGEDGRRWSTATSTTASSSRTAASIDLVSIGVVDEHGREFYAVSTEFDDPGRALGAPQRAGQAALAGRPGVALPRADPRRPLRVPGRAAARAGRASRSSCGPGTPRTTTWRWPSSGARCRRCRGRSRGSPRTCASCWDDRGRPPLPDGRRGAARRAGRRPAQPGPLAGAGRLTGDLPAHRERADHRRAADVRRMTGDRRLAMSTVGVRHPGDYSAHCGPPRAGNGADARLVALGHSRALSRRPIMEDEQIMRIGVLTGGGDCPGLNAVIRAVVRKGVADVRSRVRRLPGRLAGPAGGPDQAAGHRRGARHPAPRRHDPRLVPDQPVQDRRRRRADQGEPRRARASTRWSRSAARTPSASPPSCTTSASTSSACRRRSTTTSAPPTTRSASTPRSTSRWRRSTGCTPPPRATTARWSSR